MNNVIAWLQSNKLTILGVVSSVVSIAVAFGFIDLEQQTMIVDGVETVIDSGVTTLETVIAFVSAAAGLIGIFGKDA